MNRLLCFVLILSASAAIAQPQLDTLWTRTYGYPGRSEVAEELLISSQGGYVLAGMTLIDFDFDYDGFAVRVNSQGDTLWTVRREESFFSSVLEPLTGGYVFAGTSIGDDDWGYLLLIRTNEFGDTLWEMVLDSLPSYANAIIELSDQRLAVAGALGGSPCLFLFDSLGNLLTHTQHGMQGAWLDLALAEDGTIGAAGLAYGIAGSMMLVGQFQSDGDPVWDELFQRGQDDEARSIVADGEEFIIGGCVSCYSDTADSYIIFTADETIGGGHSIGSPHEDAARSMAITSSGNLLLAGISSLGEPLREQIFLAACDGTGDLLWSLDYGNDNREGGFDILELPNGGIIIAGMYQTLNDPHTQMYLVAFDSTSAIDDETVLIPGNLNLAVYPNPFNSSATISFSLATPSHATLTIFDLLGREVSIVTNQDYEAGGHRLAFDGSGLASGSYTAVLRSNHLQSATRFTLLK